jgi:hypothetical protein
MAVSGHGAEQGLLHSRGEEEQPDMTKIALSMPIGNVALGLALLLCGSASLLAEEPREGVMQFLYVKNGGWIK